MSYKICVLFYLFLQTCWCSRKSFLCFVKSTPLKGFSLYLRPPFLPVLCSPSRVPYMDESFRKPPPPAPLNACLPQSRARACTATHINTISHPEAMTRGTSTRDTSWSSLVWMTSSTWGLCMWQVRGWNTHRATWKDGNWVNRSQPTAVVRGISKSH